MRRTSYSFIKSHNLVNRIYDMMYYFECYKEENISYVKSRIKTKLQNIYYVETLAKYFEEQKRKNRKNIELRCNLVDLINDLDYLKQYLEKNN